MELVESIKLALQKAAEEKKKVATFHSLILVNAAQLEHLDPEAFCRNVGMNDTYATEFRKMITVSRTLSEMGYSIKKF